MLRVQRQLRTCYLRDAPHVTGLSPTVPGLSSAYSTPRWSKEQLYTPLERLRKTWCIEALKIAWYRHAKVLVWGNTDFEPRSKSLIYSVTSRFPHSNGGSNHEAAGAGKTSRPEEVQFGTDSRTSPASFCMDRNPGPLCASVLVQWIPYSGSRTVDPVACWEVKSSVSYRFASIDPKA